MDLEIDNLRLAWTWLVEHQQVVSIQKSLPALWVFYEVRGWFREGVSLFGQAVEVLSRSMATQEIPAARLVVTLGQVLAKQAHFYTRLSQYEQARHLLQQSLTLLRPMDNGAALADTLLRLGVVAHFMGNYTEARSLLHESLALGRKVGDQWTIAFCLTVLGAVAQALGEYREAYRLCQESLIVWRALGGPRGITFCLSFLSLVAHMLGQHNEAQQMLRESLAISRVLGDHWAIATALNHLGLVALSQGDAERMEAQDLLRESVAMFQELGERWSMARVLNNLGNVSLMLDDHAEAWRSFLEALKTATVSQSIPNVLDALMGIATLQVKEGRPQESLELLTHILSHSASSQETKNRAQQLRPKLETQLTPQQIEAVQTRAQVKSIEAVVAEILEQTR
jgi:tetratricopeptide (TPR) repeat protein